MKDIKDYIIKESQPESLYKAKKGDILWLCDLMATWDNTTPSCVKVTITNIDKEPISGRPKQDFEKYHIIRFDFSNNKYDIPCYRIFQVPTLRSGWMARQVGIVSLTNSKNESKNYYIGTTKEAIEELIKNDAKKELEPVLDEIAQLEKELQELNTKKEKLEATMTTKLQEIQENKQQ